MHTNNASLSGQIENKNIIVMDTSQIAHASENGLGSAIVKSLQLTYHPPVIDWSDINGLFSDQKGGNKLFSVAEISARQVLCCYQMLLPDGAGVARSLSLRLDATR